MTDTPCAPPWSRRGKVAAATYARITRILRNIGKQRYVRQSDVRVSIEMGWFVRTERLRDGRARMKRNNNCVWGDAKCTCAYDEKSVD